MAKSGAVVHGPHLTLWPRSSQNHHSGGSTAIDGGDQGGEVEGSRGRFLDIEGRLKEDCRKEIWDRTELSGWAEGTCDD